MLYGVRANIYPDAAAIGLKAIPVAMVGGMDSLAGLVPAAIIVSIAETTAITYGNPLLSDAVPMMLLLVILLVRPWGLFGTKESLEKV